MTEHALVARAKAGDGRAADTLIRRYDDLAHRIAGSYFHASLGHDDLHQAALIGIWNGIRTFDPAVSVRFDLFVAMCMKRAVITAVKTAGRQKHETLSGAVRAISTEDGDVDAVDLLPAPDMGDRLEWREVLSELARKLRVDLSPLEARCLILFANGMTYQEIGDHEDVPWKTVDRAIQRARWKLSGEGPPSDRKLGMAGRTKKAYVCPRCGGATTKRKKGRGRPPICVVCALRRDVKAA